MNTYLIILGGGLVKEKDDSFRTQRAGDEGDAFGLVLDRFRVEAGAILFKKNPGSSVIASGDRGQYKGRKDDYPTLASVLKKELSELGVPAGSIIMEEKSGTTYGQLLESRKLIPRAGGWVSIVSNEWHFLRIEAMLTHAPELKEFKNCSVELVPAEHILLDEGIHEPEIVAMRGSEEIQKRILLERKGVADIIAGRYEFKI